MTFLQEPFTKRAVELVKCLKLIILLALKASKLKFF